jgi:hypothetical protein
MINNAQHPTAWERLLSEVDGLTSHLKALSSQMSRDGGIASEDFHNQIAHAYAHLNLVWNARSEVSADRVIEKRDELIRFPTDIEPLP